MITLYTFGPAFGLPDPSPFVMKCEMLLKLADLQYRTNTRGFPRAPKGKLPYIDDDGAVIADSTLIRMHLEQKHGVDFDRGLSAYDRGVAWAVEKMLEDHVYWVLVYWRWMKDHNFDNGPKGFFRRAPAIIRPIIERMVRAKVRRNLHGHGIGRHNEAEMTALSNRAFEALSQVLGDKPYLMGSEPCGADATAFAFTAGALTPVFETPARDKAQSLANLVAYRDRMMAKFYGDTPHLPANGAGPQIKDRS